MTLSARLAPVVLTVAAVTPLTVTANPFEPDTMSDFIGQEVQKGFSAFLDAREHCGAFQSELDRARKAVANAAAAGADFQAPAHELYRRLDERDYFFLLSDVTSHPDSDHAKLDKMICPMEGVDQQVRPAYVTWVEALRTHMGADGPDAMVFTMPWTLAAAIEANQALTRTYVEQRNLQALLRAGVPMEQAVSADVYVQMLLDNHMRVLRKLNKDPNAPLGQRLHAKFLAKLGKAPGRDAAARVLALPKSGLFELRDAFVPPDPPGAGDGATRNALTAFYVLLQEDAKAYVALQKAFEGLEDGPSAIASGFAYYDDLVVRFGEAAVTAAAQRVGAAPKLKGAVLSASRSGLSLERATVWLERVLADPDITLPSRDQEVGIAASDTASIRASKDNLQMIYGRVNDVLWRDGTRASDGSDYDYFYIYFAGSKDYATLVYRHAYDGAHGADAQDMIGKLFRITAPVYQRNANQTNPIAPNWRSMGRSPEEFSIIEEGEWPEHLPIPEMTPARTREQLLADRTVEVDRSQPPTASRGRGSATPAGACRPDPGVDINLNFPATDRPTLDRYLKDLVASARSIGMYQALREACDNQPHPEIRETFIERAVGHLDPAYHAILNAKVEMMYAIQCRGPWGCAPNALLERKVNHMYAGLADQEFMQKRYPEALPEGGALLAAPVPYAVFIDAAARGTAALPAQDQARREAQARGEPPPTIDETREVVTATVSPPGQPEVTASVESEAARPPAEAVAQAPTEPAACTVEKLTSTYKSSYGEMVCEPEGNGLRCCYARSGNGCTKWLELALHADAPRLRGKWEYSNGTRGNAEFGVGNECTLQDGRWGYGSPNKRWAVKGRVEDN